MTTRCEQREKRRQEILLYGLDTFIKKGFAATKIRDIANELGISTGLFFHYFESKESLYEELIGIALQGATGIMTYDAEDPINFFETITKEIMDSFIENSMSAKLFLLVNQAIVNESVSPRIKEAISKINNLQLSIPIIIRGQEKGVIKRGNPLALATAFWGSIQGIAETMACVPDLPCPESSWIVDILRRNDK
jgi:AcrR family transcriptional regulator